jgi:hypothetical protein
VFHDGLVRPLVQAAGACGRIAEGDLSATVPELGPAPVRKTMSVLNTVLADFQEVLLLCAHGLHSIRRALDAAPAGQECPPPGAEALRQARLEVEELQRMLEGFRYFRVKLADGTITDTGVTPTRLASTPAGRRPTAAGAVSIEGAK